MVGLGPEFHRHRLADLEPAEALFREADRDFALAIGGQGKHGLSRRHDLPDFHRTLGHHTILGCAQHRVAGLVGRDIELGLDLLQAGFTRAEQVFGIVVLRTTDHLPIHQGLVAIALGTHQVQIGFGGGDLGAGGFQLQAHVLGVEFCQWLIGLDPLPFFDQSSADFAANAKRQIRLVASTDFTGIAFHRLCRRLWLHHHGRSDGDLRCLFVTTRRQ
ncbi:hypothetical protein D3C84_757440 [compost metagenome]